MTQAVRIALAKPRVMRAAAGVVLSLLAGCADSGQQTQGQVNTTDKTNGGARYTGSSACLNCHSGVAASQALTAHAHTLTPIQGESPRFPAAAVGAGVPDPPPGLTWFDVPYVLGGYVKGALFLDPNGYILTTGQSGQDAQWNLALAANGTVAGFVPFEPNAAAPLPYEYDRFVYQTTGPRPFDANRPEFQDNKPGIRGGWVEPGVQCEACHGPGGGHFTTTNGQVVINLSRIFVDPNGGQTCNQCHVRPYGDGSGAIRAEQGYIRAQQQGSELRASGAHSTFACTYCHDPHVSVTYDRAAAIRNPCTVCHTDMTMAGHGGAVFRRGEYTETLTCESCHMPFATRAASSATAAVVGPEGRMGDTRTHIFRIDTKPVNYMQFFTADGQQVQRSASETAAVTVDFVCLRCHNGIGNVFPLSVPRAAEIAGQIHDLP